MLQSRSRSRPARPLTHMRRRPCNQAVGRSSGHLFSTSAGASLISPEDIMRRTHPLSAPRRAMPTVGRSDGRTIQLTDMTNGDPDVLHLTRPGHFRDATTIRARVMLTTMSPWSAVCARGPSTPQPVLQYDARTGSERESLAPPPATRNSRVFLAQRSREAAPGNGSREATHHRQLTLAWSGTGLEPEPEPRI